MMAYDENDRLRDGTLPHAPEIDAEPYDWRDADEPESEDAQFHRGDHVELGAALLRQLSEGPRPLFDDGHLYRYDTSSGLWRIASGEEQSRIVQSFAGSTVGAGKTLKIQSTDVRGAIKLAADQAASPGAFSKSPRGVAFSDGFVEVTEAGTRCVPHAPEHRARFGYPFPFTKREPKLWLQFLHDIYRDDKDRDERIAFDQEFFGCCLVGIATRFQRCSVKVGPGANGKSTQGEIVLSVMPPGSTSAIAPHDFGNEYRRAQLAGKRLNVVSELPEAEIMSSESFKAIIAGDLTNARHIREAPFDFAPVAGHYFAANRLPTANDTTFAFWRRFVIVRMNRAFTSEECDPRTAEKIIATDQAAIVWWLIQGAVRAMTNGVYTIPTSHDAELTAWKLAADQVAQFVDEEMEPAKDPTPHERSDWLPANSLYDRYRRWADAAGHRPPLARNKFGARLAAIGTPKVKDSRGAFYALRPKDGPK